MTSKEIEKARKIVCNAERFFRDRTEACRKAEEALEAAQADLERAKRDAQDAYQMVLKAKDKLPKPEGWGA